MVAVVGAIEIVLGIDVQPMRAVEQAFAPAGDEPSRSSTTIGWAPRLKT